jgi:hypothetical protein
MELLAWLRNHFPLAVPGGELSLPETNPAPWIDDEGWLFVALRLATIDDGTIVDVREQHIALGRFADHSPARWQAYLEGTLRAAPVIVESLGGVDAMMPCDLFAYARVLGDPTLLDADAFAAKLGDREQLAIWNAALDDEAWLELLEPCGLADHVDEVKALLRPSLRLHLVEDDDDEPELGLTRLGGDPDLPPTQPWPEVDGVALTFVAQLDLAELAEYPEAHELPREGLLSFFYAPIPPDGWGIQHPVAVLHLRELDALERRATPESCERLRAYAIDFEGERQFPALESSFQFEHLRPEADVLAFYESLARQKAETPPIDDAALAELIVSRSECDFDRPAHRLLGHPASIQGDPYLDIEMSRGWENWREGTREALEHRRRALGWRLLLQVDAYQDDELLLNQDGGFFYFWIPADALAVHDFARARGCLQCH